MWFLNKRTGVRWDITSPDTLRRVQSDAGYEPCEPPDVSAQGSNTQAPGDPAETVLPAVGGGSNAPAPAPGPEEDRSPSTGSTGDESEGQSPATKPGLTKAGGPPRSARTRRRT